MPERDKLARRRSLLRCRARARAYVDDLRARTPCAHCGAPMGDWHNPEHVFRPIRRIALMVSAGRSTAAVEAEIAACTPLCRKCHMAEDGRLGKVTPAPAPGERNPNAVLTRDQVLAIRRRVDGLRAQAIERGAARVARGSIWALAVEFGISVSRIGQIARREAWAWLEDLA